jgi:hypothetical protein
LSERVSTWEQVSWEYWNMKAEDLPAEFREVKGEADPPHAEYAHQSNVIHMLEEALPPSVHRVLLSLMFDQMMLMARSEQTPAQQQYNNRLQEKLKEFAASMSSICQIYFRVLNTEKKRLNALPFWRRLFYRNTSKKRIFFKALAKLSDLDIAKITEDALGYPLQHFQKKTAVSPAPSQCNPDVGMSSHIKSSLSQVENNAATKPPTRSRRVTQVMISNDDEQNNFPSREPSSNSVFDLQEVDVHVGDVSAGLLQTNDHHSLAIAAAVQTAAGMPPKLAQAAATTVASSLEHSRVFLKLAGSIGSFGEGSVRRKEFLSSLAAKLCIAQKQIEIVSVTEGNFVIELGFVRLGEENASPHEIVSRLKIAAASGELDALGLTELDIDNENFCFKPSSTVSNVGSLTDQPLAPNNLELRKQLEWIRSKLKLAHIENAKLLSELLGVSANHLHNFIDFSNVRPSKQASDGHRSLPRDTKRTAASSGPVCVYSDEDGKLDDLHNFVGFSNVRPSKQASDGHRSLPRDTKRTAASSGPAYAHSRGDEASVSSESDGVGDLNSSAHSYCDEIEAPDINLNAADSAPISRIAFQRRPKNLPSITSNVVSASAVDLNISERRACPLLTDGEQQSPPFEVEAQPVTVFWVTSNSVIRK